MFMCTLYVLLVCTGPEEDIRISGTGGPGNAELEVQVVRSCHVGVGNRTWALSKSIQCYP